MPPQFEAPGTTSVFVTLDLGVTETFMNGIGSAGDARRRH